MMLSVLMPLLLLRLMAIAAAFAGCKDCSNIRITKVIGAKLSFSAETAGIRILLNVAVVVARPSPRQLR